MDTLICILGVIFFVLFIADFVANLALIKSKGRLMDMQFNLLVETIISLKNIQAALEDMQYENLLACARARDVVSEEAYKQHVNNAIDMHCLQIRRRGEHEDKDI